MNRVADLVEERRDDLALTLTLDQGKPLHAESYDEVEELVVYWRMAAADATRLAGSMPPSVDASKRILAYRVPRGVVGVITPWNWPYTMPAELDRSRARRRERGGLGAGAVDGGLRREARGVHRRRGAARRCLLDGHRPRSRGRGRGRLATPGSTESDSSAPIATGLQVAARAAGKTTLLELGGNGPMVVLDDADVEAAARASIAASFLCAGQSCTAGELFLVQDAVHDEFVERLRAVVESSVRLGDPLSEETTMGPLNNEPTAAKMDRHVRDALERGAQLVAGGARAAGYPDRPLLAAHGARRA